MTQYTFRRRLWKKVLWNRDYLLRRNCRDPIMANKHILVGEITVFLEIWGYDAITEVPYLQSKINIVPIDEDTPEFCLTMMDLYGTKERIHDRCNATDPVQFSQADYRREIGMSLLRLANQRQQKIEQKRNRPRKEEEKSYRPEAVKRVKRG